MSRLKIFFVFHFTFLPLIILHTQKPFIMKAKTFTCMAILFVMATSGTALKAQSKDYKDGSVWTVTMVKTKAGSEEDYLKSLKRTKTLYDEAMKQGLVLSYKVMRGGAANREDWDVMVLVEYKNMAAMEGKDAQWDALRDKVFGGEAGEKTVMKDRLEIREILGEKMMREIIYN
jgi:hypothetical protein